MGLIGGVIGGVVVLLLGLWYQSGGDELAALRGRVDQVEGKLASASSGGQIESLAKRVQALETTSGGDLASRLDALESKVEGEGATLAELEAGGGGAPGADLSGRVAQLEQQLKALEGGAGSGGGGASAGTAMSQAVKTLQDELAKISARLPEAGQLQDTQNRLAQLDQRLSTAEQAASRLKQLAGSVDQLSQQLGADQQRNQELASQIGALNERVSGAESKVQNAQRDRTRAAALALVVGQLEAAIEEARPYQTQVQTLTAMTDGSGAPGDDAIKQAVSGLQPGAASGVPGLATLRQSFDPVANEIVHAARAPEGDNLIDRAADNLMRLVTVRPVGGDVRGDTPEARVARAEAALDKGDLASAVAELDQLQGRPADAAADWLRQAKARLGADQAVAQLRAQATDLLAQSDE